MKINRKKDFRDNESIHEWKPIRKTVFKNGLESSLDLAVTISLFTALFAYMKKDLPLGAISLVLGVEALISAPKSEKRTSILGPFFQILPCLLSAFSAYVTRYHILKKEIEKNTQ